MVMACPGRDSLPGLFHVVPCFDSGFCKPMLTMLRAIAPICRGISGSAYQTNVFKEESMAAKIGRSARRSLMTFGIVVTGAIALSGCNGGDSSSDDSGPIPLTVPKATCGSGDKPET